MARRPGTRRPSPRPDPWGGAPGLSAADGQSAGAGVAGVQAAVEPARTSVECQARVLDGDMPDPVREAPHDLDGVDALPVEVTRVEGKAELLAAADPGEDRLGAVQVEGELSRM